MLQQIAGPIATIVGTYVLLFGLRRLFPYRPATGQKNRSFEELARRYAWVDQKASWSARLSWGWVLPGMFWYLVFLGLTRWLYPTPDDLVFSVVPTHWTWLLVGALAGMFTFFLARPLLLKWRLKHNYDEYRIYQKMLNGRLEALIDYGLAAIAGLGVAVLANQGWTSYALFTERNIVIEQGSTESHVYGYREIVEVRLTGGEDQRDGGSLTRHRFEIEFYDRYIWHVGKAMRSVDLCNDYPIFAYAAERSGQVIAGRDLGMHDYCH